MASGWSLALIGTMAAQNPGLAYRVAVVALARTPGIEFDVAWVVPAAARPRSPTPLGPSCCMMVVVGGAKAHLCSQEIPPAYSPRREKPLGVMQAQNSLTVWQQWLWPGPQVLSPTWLGVPSSHQAVGSFLHYLRNLNGAGDECLERNNMLCVCVCVHRLPSVH